MRGFCERFRLALICFLDFRKRHSEYGPDWYRLFRVGKLGNTKSHLFVWFTRLSFVGEKNSVPPRYTEAIIAVGFVAMY